MHVPRNLLVAVARGEGSRELLEEIRGEHMVALCEVCQKAAQEAVTEAARPGLAPPGEPLDPVERARRRLRVTDMKLRDLEEDASEDVKACVEFPRAVRRNKMLRATKRFKGSLFGALLLAKARAKIPGDPAESWSLADAVLAANEGRTHYRPRPSPSGATPPGPWAGSWTPRWTWRRPRGSSTTPT
ncbi:MAG TPA: hypothetical protein VLF66_07685 [Thermoanaerobaculia bacterium]|nr:hypothetical protein [Thermoanaerobaculia bacterium]